MSDVFTAYVFDDVDGKPKGGFKTLTLADLPDLDVLVEIDYSSLNYKDGLAITGKGRIARRLPMVGGIDIAGTVAESRSPEWKPGDKVVLNGWGLSETQQGAYSRYQRVKAEWLIPLPDAFSTLEAMAVGTAGYTAALCVDALEDWGFIQNNKDKEIVVTGAAGGVGSVAVALLAARGYRVTAATGRPETHEYLAGLGASGFIDRTELAEKPATFAKERFAGGVDSVGGPTLANVLGQTFYGGAVAACGLASSSDLPASVLPFILRGVALLGVDSVMAPRAKRERAWARLARDLDKAKLAAITTVQPMSELPELGAAIVAGKTRGRVVIDVQK
jgi:acrylyl-CoA reductase (NADPH)